MTGEYLNTETGEVARFHWIDLDMIAEALHHEIERGSVFPEERLRELLGRIRREMEPERFSVAA